MSELPVVYVLYLSSTSFIYRLRPLCGDYVLYQEALLSSLSKQNEEFTAQVSATTRFADEILINTANQVFYDSAVSKLRGGENLNDEEFIKDILLGKKSINDSASARSPD
ncbi:MAG: hypothetical protein SPD11_11110 [Sphaerochaetaceae bacterium]|nr:hypothetical protein [Sphaerochaetaceae bacterium]